MSTFLPARILILLLSSALAASAAAAPVVLRASHQFPGGKGDVRDDMVQIIAREAKAAGVDLDIQVYPGASLFKPDQQWNAMVAGQLDITLFPLDYASGKVPVFSATLMPGLIRSQERAKRINDSQFMKDIRAEIEKYDVIVLSDAWFAGGMASKSGCIVTPVRHQRHEVPRRGPDVRRHVGSGGRKHREPTVERDLQRVPERRRHRHGHEPRHLRLDATLRSHRLPHGPRRQRAVVHVRAGADVQEDRSRA